MIMSLRDLKLLSHLSHGLRSRHGDSPFSRDFPKTSSAVLRSALFSFANRFLKTHSLLVLIMILNYILQKLNIAKHILFDKNKTKTLHAHVQTTYFVNDEIVVEIYIFCIIQIFLSIQFQLMGHFATMPIIFFPSP